MAKKNGNTEETETQDAATSETADATAEQTTDASSSAAPQTALGDELHNFDSNPPAPVAMPSPATIVLKPIRRCLGCGIERGGPHSLTCTFFRGNQTVEDDVCVDSLPEREPEQRSDAVKDQLALG